MPTITHNKEIAFDDFVEPVPDHCLITDCSFVYLNMEHSSDEARMKSLAETVEDRTGFPVIIGFSTLDILLAAKVPLSRAQRMHFMAGHPIWHIPAMFTRVGKGINHSTGIGSTLDEAMAIQAVLGKTVIKKSLELQYQRRKDLANGKWYRLAEQHADEVVMEALGSRQSVDKDGKSKNKPVNIKECDGIGKPTGCEIVGSRRYAKQSVAKVAAKAINGSKAARHDSVHSLYRACIERASLEIAENIFDARLDGVALAAWYYRVVTALRIAASVCGNLDSQRRDFVKQLQALNKKYQRLRRRRRSRIVQNRLSERRDDISRIVRNYNVAVGHSLEVVSGLKKTRQNIIFERVDPTIAAIVAFHAGVNLRAVSRSICDQLGVQFNAVLESLVWLGHLQRQRARNLTAEVACAFEIALRDDGDDQETRRVFTYCMEIGLSFLDGQSRVALNEAAIETARTGSARTVTLEYRPVTRRARRELAEVADGLVPLQPNLQDLAPPDILRPGPSVWAFDAEIGAYVGTLKLQGTLVSLPPFYQRDWDRRWRFDRSEEGNRFSGFRRQRRPAKVLDVGHNGSGYTSAVE